MNKIKKDYVKEVYQKLHDNPYSAGVHYEAGIMYFEQGNLTSALRYFEKAVELEPNNIKALNKIKEIKEKIE